MATTALDVGRKRATLAWWGIAAVVAVFVISGLDWVGWATGADELTRGLQSWPQMPPWTAALLAILGVAVLLQTGRPSRVRVGAGCVMAAAAGVLALLFLVEYATGRSLGLDALLFPDAVADLPDAFPGRRPSLQAAWSVLMLSFAACLLRLDRRWSQVVWPWALAAAVIMPLVTLIANVFGDSWLKGGQANTATVGVGLLISAMVLGRPDRNPLAWMVDRPDRWPLVRLLGVLAGLPLVMGLSRLVFLGIGVRGEAMWVLSIAVTTTAVGAGAFYIGQRELRLLLEKEIASGRRADSERKRLDAVLANAPSAISVRDRQYRYTVVNDAFCELFGQDSVAEVIGRAEADILPTDVVARSRRADVRLLAGENFFEEEPISRADETLTVLTQRFALRDDNGAATELVTIRTDITHRRKALQEIAERRRWHDEIAAAIAEDRLLVYSQPIVDIASRDKVGEELLVRFRDRETGQILPPSGFLPQCERHDLMPVIDRYMLGRAIELAGRGRNVNVNISGRTISDDGVMTEIFETLKSSGPHIDEKIIFEITETTAVASHAMAKAFSLGMAGLGCRVVLDDFGTGYGSFTELRHLKLYSLKIDQSFVRNMLNDADDERVVNTMVFIANSYGLSSVAEGVESQEVLDRLAELGAQRAQGYHLGRPQPVVW